VTAFRTISIARAATDADLSVTVHPCYVLVDPNDTKEGISDKKTATDCTLSLYKEASSDGHPSLLVATPATAPPTDSVRSRGSFELVFERIVFGLPNRVHCGL